MHAGLVWVLLMPAIVRAQAHAPDNEIAPSAALVSLDRGLLKALTPDERALLLAERTITLTTLSRYGDAQASLKQARALRFSPAVAPEVDLAEATLREKLQRTLTAGFTVETAFRPPKPKACWHKSWQA